MPDSSDATIAFDIRAAFGSNGRRGIGRYIRGLARALERQDCRTLFLAPPDRCDADSSDDLGVPLTPLSASTLRSLAAGSVAYLVGSLFEMPISADVVPTLVTNLGWPVAAVWYDAIPYAEPDRYQSTAALRAFYDQRAALARSCDGLLAISRYAAGTTTDLLSYPARRVTVVGTGVDDSFAAGETDDRVPQIDGLSRQFVICVGGNDARKNVGTLINAFARLPEEVRRQHQLVVVGAIDAQLRETWCRGAVRAAEADAVLFTGDIDDHSLRWLYRHASLSVFPSLSEGFGLPVAEAAACGCPTITSNTTSIPEILDLPASTFDPSDAASIAQRLQLGLTDQVFRKQLSEAGAAAAAAWQWERVADIVTSTMMGLVTARPRPIRRTRIARIALVGPFGGSTSGIGAYNERLLAPLDEHAEVMCFVEDFAGVGGLGTDGRRFPARALGRHIDPGQFDHVVYTLGNSPFHLTSVLQLIPRIAGHLWLHEAQLVELHLGAAHLFKNQTWGEEHLTKLIRLEAGDDAVRAIRGDLGWDGMLDLDRYRQRGIRLLRSSLVHAQTVIVSSQLAAEIVSGPPVAYRGDLLVLPIAFPQVDESATSAGETSSNSPARREIAVLGWLSTAKGIERAISLLAAVRSNLDARMVFVGKALEGADEALCSAAQRFGVADAVEVTGFLPHDQLRDRLRGCRVGLRLGSHSDGEMSAAVNELVALGVPTVTNLVTMGDSSPGLIVHPAATDADLANHVRILLADDAAWERARLDAIVRARAWGFPEVAACLIDWLIRHG